MPSGNPAIVPFTRDGRHIGRAKGTPNVATKILKHAIVLAGEQSRHSRDGTLLSYFIHIADEYPALYIGLIGRLIPVEAKVKTDFERPQRLTSDMSLEAMVKNFEAQIKDPNYHPSPRTIEHNDDSDSDSDDDEIE